VDFSQIDEIISRLEKKVSPGSPPVVVDGTLGLFRTLRGFRTFLELVPGPGKYEFEGKSYKGGRVLMGPPNLVGQNINDVDNDTWDSLSGSGTKEKFGVASADGVQKLKQSVRNLLDEKDTRQAALDNTNNLAEIVQIARSAGFTDQNIKEALKGKVFENALSQPDKPKTKAPVKPNDNVSDLKPKKPATPNVSSGQGNMTASGEVTFITDALKDQATDTPVQRQAFANQMREFAKASDDELLAKQLNLLASGVLSEDLTVKDAIKQLQYVIDNQAKALVNSLTKEEQETLREKGIVKPIVRELEEAEKEAQKNPSPVAEAELQERIVEKIVVIEKTVQNVKVKQQLVALRQDLQKKRIGGNSAILRLLQIIRFILAFIPG
jgi:hypothetical protein